MKKHIFFILLSLIIFQNCSPEKIKEDEIKEEKTEVDNKTKLEEVETSNKTKEEIEEIKEVVVPTAYQKESEGAPSKPTWIDAFRHYPELEFFKKGRYLLVWRKDPGDTGLPAEKWEVHKITFNDPGDIRDNKFGKPINPNDVKEVEVIFSSENIIKYESTETISLPTNLLPPDEFSSDSSQNYAALTIPVNANTQVGYVPIKTDQKSRQAAIAYKIRAYRTVKDTDDSGNDIKKTLYNDSPVIMIDYRSGKFIQIIRGDSNDGSGDNGSSGTSTELVADKLKSIVDVRKKLSLSSNAYFSSNWENRKLSGTAPIEEILTKSDFEKMFPPEIRKQGHDKVLTYYTWENLVEASRYFPKFLAEGTKEDKYRELAALMGNKSHETGDGWPALGEKRWEYGLFWIVELSALSGSGISINPKNQEDLYKAFLANYVDSGNANYPPVEGKSYHGRGPVQLSWNYNYGAMSEQMFENKNILLENPNLVAREGIYGWASALWFWMEPQGSKPSGHDVMVGNVDLSEPYTPPTSRDNRTARTHTLQSKGHDAAGKSISYEKYSVPAGVEVGFGLTINIINGGLESNTGNIDNRQARRIGFFARYLDYFGKIKLSLNKPLSPQVGGKGGDSVPDKVVELMKGWRNWHYLPGDGKSSDGNKDFPKDEMPSIMSSKWMSSF